MMLSEEEISEARLLIDRYRRFSRQWKSLRWVVLMVGLLLLGMSVFGFNQMEKLATFNRSDRLALDGKQTAGNEGVVMDVRLDLLREELQIYSGIILNGATGALLVMMVLYGWKRQSIGSMLKAKLLESALENELAADRSLEFMKEEDA